MNSDNAVSKFIVVAMPRSRTYWMSKLFDAEHDYIQDADDVDCFFADEDRGCVNTRPSALVGSERLSEARVAIVDRDPIEVYQSLIKAFPEYCEGNESLIEFVIEEEAKALEEIKNSIDAPVYYYEELIENDVVAEMWSWLMPDVPVDMEKIEMFQDKVLKMEEQ